MWLEVVQPVAVFEANYTHNATKMADEAGIYWHVWRPYEIGIETAGELVDPLTDAIRLMRAQPDKFKALNPANGWGDYDSFLDWLETYRDACKDNPSAKVQVSG